MSARLDSNSGSGQFGDTNAKTGSNVEGKSDSQNQPLRRLVAQQPFFAGMTPKQLDVLADSAVQMQFEPGQWIFLEGDLANRFFLILEGHVVLETDADERGRIPIQVLGPGDDLGWSWLFPPYHFHFSARALAPEVTKVICFYGTRLRHQCEADQNLGYTLMKRIAQVTISRLEATRQQLLKFAPPSEPQA
jgi:CRP/FNR family transcriptional regulator, cyclic AMP receptor protein